MSSLATIISRAQAGIEAPQVSVEVNIAPGLPSLSIVGLPETAVKESKDRVRCALLNSGFTFPNKRITINLAPADLPKKEGGRFDLPIALGILIASQQLSCPNLDTLINQHEFAGELGLTGELKWFRGALPFALATRKTGNILVIPDANADEASLPENLIVLKANSLLDVCQHLEKSRPLLPYKNTNNQNTSPSDLDLSDIYGQEYAKRALVIAAAGEHSLLLTGPPGTGKTMLASRLNSILPQMSEDEALESMAIHSVAGKIFNIKIWRERPFRSPHHTASGVALVGGASPPKPGEISLAHNGVLFLDELPEFNRAVLEALREPLEAHSVTIARAAHSVKFPAKFQLITAMNPCPCGHFGDKQILCSCAPDQIQRYQNRISGPFLDRIDLHVKVNNLPKSAIMQRQKETGLNSEQAQKLVIAARALQINRAGKCNSYLGNKEIARFCALSKDNETYLENVMDKMQLSARAYHRTLKIARTIADLVNNETINEEHLAEALSYRKIRNNFSQ